MERAKKHAEEDARQFREGRESEGASSTDHPRDVKDPDSAAEHAETAAA